MCGRFTITVTLEELITHYLIDDSKLATLKPNYNVAPMHNVPAVIASDEGNRLGELRWGLVPFWAKDEKIGSKMIPLVKMYYSTNALEIITNRMNRTKIPAVDVNPPLNPPYPPTFSLIMISSIELKYIIGYADRCTLLGYIGKRINTQCMQIHIQRNQLYNFAKTHQVV
ncbi:hypothetical protein QW71_19865 [Paenibacillus sp. IHB B 3415]|nr:hypothetical protein QW71_19865 [Paenibacillus sp. IHB B 3415]